MTKRKESIDPSHFENEEAEQPNSIISQVNIKVNPITSQRQVLQKIQKEA